MESASTYAQIEGLSFEVTALKFLEIGQIEALKLYLLKVTRSTSKFLMFRINSLID